MPTRMEVLLKRTAGVAAVLSLALLTWVFVSASPAPWAPWVGLVCLYLTGVGYGLGEMTRLYHRHRRRCKKCLEGAGPHVRWWAFRVVLVLVVSLLPVLMVASVVTGGDPGVSPR